MFILAIGPLARASGGPAALRLNMGGEQRSCAVGYLVSFFFFNDPGTTEISPLSLPDALPIWSCSRTAARRSPMKLTCANRSRNRPPKRSEEHTPELQSPYVISYAVLCLKKLCRTSLMALRLDSDDVRGRRPAADHH